MPTLVIIEGIKIMMFERDHEPPHVHIITADAAAIWDIRYGRQIALRGRLTRRETRMITDWIETNRDDLLALWNR